MINKINRINYTSQILSNFIIGSFINKNSDLNFIVKDRNIVKALTFEKFHSLTKGKSLMDIYSIDYPFRKNRFELNYNLLSITYNTRVFYKLLAYQDKPVESTMNIFNSANWLEREIWDMFGIFFKNHKDLRRILTDYGFEGFPLRKDFPLTGYLQFRYDDEAQTVISEPVELTQEYRNYQYTMPWTINI